MIVRVTVSTVAISKSVVLSGFLGFLLIGAVQAFYGAAQFGLREAYGVDAVSVGVFSSLLFAGSVIGISSFPLLERRFGLKSVLLGSSVLLGLGMLGVALSASWALALLSVLVIGLGFGGLDVGFNLHFSTAFGSRSATYSNVLNAMFGIGSVLGPLLIGLLGDYRQTYALWAAFTLGLMALIASSKLRSSVPTSAPAKLHWSWWLGLFVLFFFLYVIVEVGAAGAQPRHLRDALGYSEQSAAFYNALFWSGLTVGRLLGAAVALRVPAQGLVLTSSLLLLGALVATHIAPLAPFAYTVAGVACGPIFPTGLVWLSRLTGGNAAVTSLVVAAASLGGVAAPFAVAALAGSNAALIPSALSALAVALALLNLALLWQSKGVSREARV
jgi:MFS transporter, FHS family, glucose/mannose:H+ symporter